MGPNAFRTLNTAGILIFTGASGSIRQAIEKYKSGELKLTEVPTSESKKTTSHEEVNVNAG